MDLPDITILGWTPAPEHTLAGGAVLVGIIIAVAVIAFLKRASRLLLISLIAIAIGTWVWLR